jgi:C4-dicarboxylate transporter, DctM subunit
MLQVGLSLFTALFLTGVPVAAALAILAIILVLLFSPLPLIRAMGEISWSTGNDFLLVAVPLYILMGELLLRSGIAGRTYDAMVRWLSWLPGGLMHSNIGVSAVFAATSGSSVVTAATVGTVAAPQAAKFKYNERLFLGSIAAGGTLGILIPPSINLLIYGFITETSVPQLYVAALIPAAILCALFVATIAIACIVKPEWGGVRQRFTWSERFASLRHLVPPFLLFLLVVGSIYAGWATPTESAALGVIGALVLSALNRALTLDMLKAALENTMRVTGMAMLIVLAAFFLSFVVSILGINRDILAFVQALDLTPVQLMIAIVIFYIILGCFLDPLAMMVTTIPIVAPLVSSLGYDLIWFGILIVVLCEMALITPPFGVNLFVVQAVRRSGPLADVIIGALPFALTLLGLVILLLVWPSLALWLPSMFGAS